MRLPAFHRFAGRFEDAWDATGPMMCWSGIISLICGVAFATGWVRTPPLPLGPNDGLWATVWDVTVLATLFSVPLFGMALLGFYMYLVNPPYRPYDLATVHSQKVHDTGGLAREAAIDAALRDEDEEGPPLLDFGE